MSAISIEFFHSSFAIVNAQSAPQHSIVQSRSASPRLVHREQDSEGNRSSSNGGVIQHHQQPQQHATPTHSSHIINSNISSQERTLYITFFCLTTTFLLCHLPRILLNIYEVPMSQDRELCRQVTIIFNKNIH